MNLSPNVLLALAPLLLLALALDVYCLVDIVRSPSVRNLPKLVWVLVVVLVNAPFGASAYLIWGRNRHDRRAAGLDADELAELGGTGPLDRR